MRYSEEHNVEEYKKAKAHKKPRELGLLLVRGIELRGKGMGAMQAHRNAKRVARSESGVVWDAMHLKAKKRREEAKTCREGEVTKPCGGHGERAGGKGKARRLGLKLLVNIRRRACGFGPWPSRPMWDAAALAAPSRVACDLLPRIWGSGVPPPIERHHLVLLHHSLAHRAFLAHGMAPQPSIEAWPAEKMPAQGYNRVLCQFKAYVAVEAPTIAAF